MVLRGHDLKRRMQQGRSMTFEHLLQITYDVSLGAVLWATAIAIGLRITARQLAGSFRPTRLMLKAVLLNLAIIPVGVWILMRILPVEQGVAIGLLLLAAAVGGPFGLTAAQLAGGEIAFALSLVAVLQVARVVTIPFWLGVFLPFGLPEMIQIIAALVSYILLPLMVGMLLRRFLGDRSARWSRAAQGIGSVLISVVIVSAILLQHNTLAALAASWTMLLILGIQFLSGGLGYVLGGPEPEGRRTVAVMAIVRSSAAALLIANQMYAGQPFVAATVVTYGVVALSAATLAAVGMSRVHRLDSIRVESAGD
jgi:BASS family bile acid:Na+ symporter